MCQWNCIAFFESSFDVSLVVTQHILKDIFVVLRIQEIKTGVTVCIHVIQYLFLVMKDTLYSVATVKKYGVIPFSIIIMKKGITPYFFSIIEKLRFL